MLSLCKAIKSLTAKEINCHSVEQNFKNEIWFSFNSGFDATIEQRH